MAKEIRNAFVVFLVGMVSFSAGAIEFSKDSINAFDGKYWGNNAGDDSVFITNTGNQGATIDSIFIQFDNPGYGNFNVSWMMTDSGSTFPKRTGFYAFAGDAAPCNLARADLDLKKYNQGLVTKIKFKAGETRKMYSPYFSETCSLAGVFVDCFDCPLLIKWHFSYFPGRIIFVSQYHWDTLRLMCEKSWWTTAVLPIKASAKTVQKAASTTVVNLQGKKIPAREACSPSNSVVVRKGRMVILKTRN